MESVIIAIVIFLVQTSLPGMKITGLPKPDLLLAYVISMAFITDYMTGALYGFCIGLACDLVLMRAIGLNTLIYMFAGILSGMLNRRVYQENALVPMVITLYLTTAAETARYFVHVLTYGQINYIYVLREIILPCLFMNCIAAGIFHLIFAGRFKNMKTSRWGA